MGERKKFSWRKWTWVFAFAAVTAFLYSHFMKEKRASVRELSFRLEEMEKERLLAFQEKEELNLRIASESDPAWIEMVLMRDLGVVPEGWLKVHFKK